VNTVSIDDSVQLSDGAERPNAIDAESIEVWCIDYIARTLNIPSNEIDPVVEFNSFGLDSATGTAMILDLEEWIGVDIPPSAIFENVTIRNLAADLMRKFSASAPGARQPS
jgi:acyl carrier protein